MVATTVGFMTIILAVWLWRADERPWMKRLGVFALLGVILQGVLGGLTVIFMLPKAISIAHACLAELFFSTTVAIAVFTSRGWRRQPEIVDDEGWPSLRTAAVFLPLLVLAQVALGAAFRHRALNVLPHVFGALVVTGFILYVAICAMEHPSMKKPAVSLLSITFFQVFLGIAAYMSRISTIESVQPLPVMVAFTVAHVAVGALTMAGSVILSIYLLRSVRRPVVGLRQAA
jgi:cytochrome c oxidase assembly protein subunit 15